MNYRAIIFISTLMCTAIILAGCTGTQSPSVETGPGTQPPSAGAPATTTAANLVPTSVDVLDAARTVNVNIDKDYLGTIHATFQGGPGLQTVRNIEVTVNRADGQVKTATVGINVDDTAEIEGTKDSDRVIVRVSLSDGKTYKIFDDIVAFKPY